jgi:hypothetical protein
VPRAHEQLALDEAVADSTAIVGALVIDHDDPATLETRDRDRAGTVAGREDSSDRDKAKLVELRPPVIRVVAKLVE